MFVKTKMIYSEKKIFCLFVIYTVGQVHGTRHSINTQSIGRFTFERIHNTKEQIIFYERAEKHKSKERTILSFKRAFPR